MGPSADNIFGRRGVDDCPLEDEVCGREFHRSLRLQWRSSNGRAHRQSRLQAPGEAGPITLIS